MHVGEGVKIVPSAAAEDAAGSSKERPVTPPLDNGDAPAVQSATQPVPSLAVADDAMRPAPPPPPNAPTGLLDTPSAAALGYEVAQCCAGVVAMRDKGRKRNEPCWVVCMAPPFPDGHLHCKAGLIALYDIKDCDPVPAASSFEKVYAPKQGAFHNLPKGNNCSKVWRFSRIGQPQARHSDADAHALLTGGLGDAITVKAKGAGWAVTVKLWQEKTREPTCKPRTLLFRTEEAARSWATGLKLILAHTAPSLIAEDQQAAPLSATTTLSHTSSDEADDDSATTTAPHTPSDEADDDAEGSAAEDAIEARAVATGATPELGGAAAQQAAAATTAGSTALGSARGSNVLDGGATQEIDAVATRARVSSAAAQQQQPRTRPTRPSDHAPRVAVAGARRLLSISPASFARIADALLREEGGVPSQSVAVVSDAEAFARGQLEERGAAHPPDTRGACMFALTRDGALVCEHDVVCMRLHAIAVWPVPGDKRSFVVDQTHGADTAMVVDNSARHSEEAIDAGAARTFRAPDAASAALWLGAFERAGWTVPSAGAGTEASPTMLAIHDAVERVVAVIAPSFAEFDAAVDRQRALRAVLRTVFTATAAAQPLAPQGQLASRTAVLALASLVSIEAAGAQAADATVVDTLLGMHSAARDAIPFSSVEILIRMEIVVGNALAAAAHARLARSEAPNRPVEATVATMLALATLAMGGTSEISNANQFAAWYAAVRRVEFRAEESAWAASSDRQESAAADATAVQRAALSPTAARLDAAYGAFDAVGATPAEPDSEAPSANVDLTTSRTGPLLTPAEEVPAAEDEQAASFAATLLQQSQEGMRQQFYEASGVAAANDARSPDRTRVALGSHAQPAAIYSSSSAEPTSPAMREASSIEIANVARALATSWRRIEEQQRVGGIGSPLAAHSAELRSPDRTRVALGGHAQPAVMYSSSSAEPTSPVMREALSIEIANAARANATVEQTQWRRQEQVVQLVAAERAARFAAAPLPEDLLSPTHRQRRELGAPLPAPELDATERLLAAMWGASPSTLAVAEEAARGAHRARTGRKPQLTSALQWIESPRGQWDDEPNRRARGASPTLRELAQRDVFDTYPTPDAPPKLSYSTGWDIEHFPDPGDYPSYTHGPSNPPQSGYAARGLRTHTGANGEPAYGTYTRSDDPFTRKWNDVNSQIEEQTREALRAGHHQQLLPPQPLSEVDSWRMDGLREEDRIALEDDARRRDEDALRYANGATAPQLSTARLAYSQVRVLYRSQVLACTTRCSRWKRPRRPSSSPPLSSTLHFLPTGRRRPSHIAEGSSATAGRLVRDTESRADFVRPAR